MVFVQSGFLCQNSFEKEYDDVKEVKKLRLQNRQIATIDPKTFENFAGLMKLYLHKNQISNIEPKTFEKLTNLTCLWLDKNQITTIDPKTFQNLTNLKDLDLSDNPISTFHANTFDTLINLEKLFLQNSKIASIESNIFDKLINLKELHLQKNQIATIHPKAFEKLISLEILFLQNNQIETIEPKTFDPLTNLLELYLNDNQISSLNSELFNNLKKIQLIQVDNNKLPHGTLSYFDGSSPVWSQPFQFITDCSAFLLQFTTTGSKIDKTKDEDHYNHYEQIEFIGHGAFGCVFKVLHRSTKTFKAMKKVEGITGRKELSSYKMLKHENIVEYFEGFEHQDNDLKIFICIVVEYCEEGDLSRQIRKAKSSLEKRIPDQKILLWIRQAANGLCYLHSKKIVHRDIKPQNLLLTAQDKLKICDFGLTKCLETSLAESVVGAQAYMSPEVCFDPEVYAIEPYKTDVWSLGCVLFELIHLEMAFSSNPNERIDWNIKPGDLRSFKTILPKMLEVDARLRVSSNRLYEELASLNICKT